MRIYRSAEPPLPVVQESIFTHVFGPDFNKHPGHAPAYIDAASGFTLTRSQARSLSLSFAYGLRHAFAQMGGVALSRGDVVMVYSPNSIAWPIVLHETSLGMDSHAR